MRRKQATKVLRKTWLDQAVLRELVRREDQGIETTEADLDEVRRSVARDMKKRGTS